MYASNPGNLRIDMEYIFDLLGTSNNMTLNYLKIENSKTTTLCMYIIIKS